MKQAELFPAQEPAAAVPGFTLLPDYISGDEERQWLAQVEGGPWEADWRRRIQQFGLGYADDGTKLTWVRDFPDWLVPLADRAAKDAHLERFPENCVINEYVPPLGIAPHKDYPAFGPTIACVSLGSDIVLDFVRSDGGQHISVLVPARSLWVITGEARSKWMHGIAPRLSDVINGERRRRGRRISITFRTAKDAKNVPHDRRMADRHGVIISRPPSP